MTAFTADTATIRTAVCKVVRIVPDSVPVPVLKGILIRPRPWSASVEFLATDFETTYRATVPAQVKGDERVLVDAATLARIARNLPAAEVTVELDGWALVLSSGRARYRLLTMPQQDHPGLCGVEADLSKVRPAGMDAHERALVPAQLPEQVRKGWKPSRSKTLYDPQGMQPGAAITWSRKVGDEFVEVSGQVWSAAPTTRAVWALVEGERRPSLVAEHTYGGGSWSAGDYRKVTKLEETTPHWVAFPKNVPTATAA